MLLGILWICTGVVTPLAPPLTGNTLLSWFPWIRAALWIVTGAVAVVFSFRGSGRDAWGWLFLYIMALYSVLAYGFGTLDWALAADSAATLRNAFGTLSWLAIIVIIVVCSGWREHPSEETGMIPVIKSDPEEDHGEGGRGIHDTA